MLEIVVELVVIRERVNLGLGLEESLERQPNCECGQSSRKRADWEPKEV
jgi:hypothetical protein